MNSRRLVGMALAAHGSIGILVVVVLDLLRHRARNVFGGVPPIPLWVLCLTVALGGLCAWSLAGTLAAGPVAPRPRRLWAVGMVLMLLSTGFGVFGIASMRYRARILVQRINDQVQVYTGDVPPPPKPRAAPLPVRDGEEELERSVHQSGLGFLAAALALAGVGAACCIKARRIRPTPDVAEAESGRGDQ